MLDEESSSKVVEQNDNLFFETESSGKIPLIRIFNRYEVRKESVQRTAELLDLEESEVHEALYCIHSEDLDLYSRLEQNIGDYLGQKKESEENTDNGKNHQKDELESFRYLERDNGDIMVWDREKDDNNSIVEYADRVFTDFFDIDLDIDDIMEARGLDRDQVREVVSYAEKNVENMHELARKSYEKRNEMEMMAEQDMDDIRRRAVRDPTQIKYRNYNGALGLLQDFVENQVDERGFKMVYSPDSDEVYSSNLEMHVLTDEDADEAFYFGSDSEGEVYFGSTSSEGVRFVDDVEDDLTKHFVKQELNNLVL